MTQVVDFSSNPSHSDVEHRSCCIQAFLPGLCWTRSGSEFSGENGSVLSGLTRLGSCGKVLCGIVMEISRKIETY
jgi:hypothetical protein